MKYDIEQVLKNLNEMLEFYERFNIENNRGHLTMKEFDLCVGFFVSGLTYGKDDISSETEDFVKELDKRCIEIPFAKKLGIKSTEKCVIGKRTFKD